LGRRASVSDPEGWVARRAVRGWVLYDFANVIFSMNIASLYFPLWVVKNAGGSDGEYAVAAASSMFLVFVLAPFIGTMMDQTGRRMPFLMGSTVLCCALTLGLGYGGLWVALAVFALANATFGCGLVAYDALLPLVSTDEDRGRVGGRGIAAGFGGALVGIAAGLVILGFDEAAKPTVFKVTAVLFLLASIPCFLWVKEPPSHKNAGLRRAVSETKRELRGAVRRARTFPDVPRFLIGRVFYTDAASTIFAFMGVYATKEVGFSDFQVQIVLLSGVLSGPVGALAAGRAADRIGPKKTLDRLLLLWMAVLAACALIPALGLPSWLFWFVTPFGGIAFGGTSATDRALLFRITPPRHSGHFVGLFNMVGRFSAILGPLVWAVEVSWLGWGRPAAVATLAGFVVLSWRLFVPIDDSVRTWWEPEMETAPLPLLEGAPSLT
jgi:UMF1 family MFS transporter